MSDLVWEHAWASARVEQSREGHQCPVRVYLPEILVGWAHRLGEARQKANRKRTDNAGRKADSARYPVAGVLAELALSCFIRKPMINTKAERKYRKGWKGPDVGPYDVKATEDWTRPWLKLQRRKFNSTNAADLGCDYALVLVEEAHGLAKCDVMGWAQGTDILQDDLLYETFRGHRLPVPMYVLGSEALRQDFPERHAETDETP